ncbi:conserved hypothetical protein [Altererythrobacter sp. B11]|uniref:hypothetical protein n=1 Tax=Altererythrobacter sp. B11 TaxID=2060312 RepID=UPI000DC6FEC9|nr:hypothetical protein [Altererythrobacter sp. B11]BBC74029.1 conserved hypothetical protein [Altererythrobacter sp. B11]
MPIRIEPAEGTRLKLGGDVETMVSLSLRAQREGFALAFSDGTLLRGSYDLKLRELRLQLASEGRSNCAIRRCRHGDMAMLDAPIDWISIAAGSDALSPSESSEEADATQLELAIRPALAA